MCYTSATEKSRNTTTKDRAIWRGTQLCCSVLCPHNRAGYVAERIADQDGAWSSTQLLGAERLERRFFVDSVKCRIS
jgi:hypothetical protein